ncbi:ABC transporter ATP-binding protein [Spiroplasma chrysopicola]|uniref:ATP-binding cassette, subfamily B, bacterial n=1 Tax=Spiroplasma chrysopicola DF-1 TaxID=1276227 RepID=R4UGU7_9MOLU|nr:ABC transporter ATP-binding protein [Spiroplasma chrysopicola]AGM25375.1 ATP-binding cassette, subfamily B, bacterial [Spiroplasma chrysopicola DF-1]
MDKIGNNHEDYIIEKLKIKNEDINNSKTKINKKGFWKLVLPYYATYWPLCTIFLLFSVITSGILVAMPILVNQLLNTININVAAGKIGLEWMTVIYAGIGLLITYVLYAMFWISRYTISGVLARRIETKIRVRLLAKLLRLDLHFYHNKKTGDILTKLISDTQILGDQAEQIPLQVTYSIFSFFGASIVMFLLDNSVMVNGVQVNMKDTVYIVAAIVLGLTLLITIAIIFLYNYLRKLQYRVRRVLSSVNGDIQDRIHNIRLIKASGTLRHETERFENINEDYFKLIRHWEIRQGVIWGLILAMLFSVNGVVIIVGVVFVNKNALNPIVMVSVLMSVNQMINPLVNLIGLMNNIISASVSASRLNEILTEPERILANEGEIIVEKITGDIIFQNVDFKYSPDGEKVLDNFNFTFKQGHSYALVGQTGSGKSTISRLLLRFYDPIAGALLINNDTNLKNVNLKSFLNHVGYVEQEPQILFATIAENIAYGLENISQEAIYAAAKKAKLYDFVMSLPEQFETVVGERGHILSGGQKQRLVIARMFLRNPEVLILDEATSALDNLVEKDIQKELDALMKGRTTIVIAHRLTTVKNVDQILVLAPGKGICQTGTFEKLRKEEGYFRDMYEASFS